MGAGCSFCGPVAGKSSYDLQGQRNHTNSGNQAARENVKSNRDLEEAKSDPNHPFVTQTAEGSENSGLTSNEIVSQSQCEVNFNTGSTQVLDSNVEITKTGNDEESNQNSTLATPNSELQTSEFTQPQARPVVTDEDFKPGHATRMENTAEKQTAGHAKTSGNDELLNVPNQASDEEIQAVVDKCWKEIEDSCKSQHANRNSNKFPQSVDSEKGWRVVRLFVSSTFADYHAEREVLVKKVSICCFISMQNMFKSCMKSFVCLSFQKIVQHYLH